MPLTEAQQALKLAALRIVEAGNTENDDFAVAAACLAFLAERDASCLASPAVQVEQTPAQHAKTSLDEWAAESSAIPPSRAEPAIQRDAVALVLAPLIECLHTVEHDTMGQFTPDTEVVWHASGSWNNAELTLGDVKKIRDALAPNPLPGSLNTAIAMCGDSIDGVTKRARDVS